MIEYCSFFFKRRSPNFENSDKPLSTLRGQTQHERPLKIYIMSGYFIIKYIFTSLIQMFRIHDGKTRNILCFSLVILFLFLIEKDWRNLHGFYTTPIRGLIQYSTPRLIAPVKYTVHWRQVHPNMRVALLRLGWTFWREKQPIITQEEGDLKHLEIEHGISIYWNFKYSIVAAMLFYKTNYIQVEQSLLDVYEGKSDFLWLLVVFVSVKENFVCGIHVRQWYLRQTMAVMNLMDKGCYLKIKVRKILCFFSLLYVI